MTEYNSAFFQQLVGLTIVPPKQKKSVIFFDIKHLCSIFDSTTPLDSYIDSNGSFNSELALATQISSQILDEIFDISLEKSQTQMSSECSAIVQQFDSMLKKHDTLLNLMIGMSISFGSILKNVAISGNFDDGVVKNLLDEVVMLLRIMLSSDDERRLPDSWESLKQTAMLQIEVFKSYTSADTYERAQDSLWKLEQNTSLEKDYLSKCIRDSIGFEAVMLELGPALDSMLSLQDIFIIKMIARLQASNIVKDKPFLNAAEC